MPNALPVSAYARAVKDRLAHIQLARTQLELTMLTNEHAETDVIPGEPPKAVDGKLVYEDGELVFPTYGEHLATFDAQAQRLIERAEQRPGAMVLVRKLIAADEAAGEAEVAEALADES